MESLDRESGRANELEQLAGSDTSGAVLDGTRTGKTNEQNRAGGHDQLTHGPRQGTNTIEKFRYGRRTKQQINQVFSLKSKQDLQMIHGGRIYSFLI
jgi:hypothetical protein